VLRLYLYARVRLYHHLLHTGPRVQQAPGIPCALLFGRNGWQSPGETRRGKVKVCSPSSSALRNCALGRTIQYSKDAGDRADRPRRTGYPACAGYDGWVWEEISGSMRRIAPRNNRPSLPR
jgi:hypothetical protein